MNFIDTLKARVEEADRLKKGKTNLHIGCCTLNEAGKEEDGYSLQAVRVCFSDGTGWLELEDTSDNSEINKREWENIEVRRKSRVRVLTLAKTWYDIRSDCVRFEYSADEGSV